MDCIILVKQVPDVSNIPEDAWDREKGTLRRAMLDSVINPLDLHALTFAEELTRDDPDARVVFLTMGPPAAREMLVDCLARLPGQAVLLTDKAFAGADTGATAYSLAQAIRRIGAEGTEDVHPLRWPVLITMTAATKPLYRSFSGAREARIAAIHEWDAATVEADPTRIGLKGSWTQVYRLFSPSEARQKECQFVRDPVELIDKIARRYEAAGHPAVSSTIGDDYDLAGREPSYRGELWVYAETEGVALRSVSLELLGKVRQLADELGERLGAVLVTDDAGDRAQQLIAAGADTVYVLEHPLLSRACTCAHKDVIARLVLERKPQALLFGASPRGRELAPRVAYACRCGLTADCTQLEIGDYAKGQIDLVGILKQTRPALGGNVMATIMTKDSQTQMATVRPGVFKVPTPDFERTGEVIRLDVDLDESHIGLETTPVESFASKVSIRDAEVIVAGGHGFHSRADFERYLQPLAEGLGNLLGAETKVAASRMAVEDGCTTHDFQVGQTGQTVQPRLYFAIGIWGAIQHITGMQSSEVIVAINKDPKAKIFDYADFGVVGDIETVIPDLTRALEVQQ